MEEDKEEIMPAWVVEDSFPEHDIEKKDEVSLPGLNKSPGGQKKIIRKIIWFIILVLLLYTCYRFFSFYITPYRAIQQTYLIPKDAVFIIQSDNPVADWKQFSESKPWKCLKQSPSFAEIAGKAATLDSILHENKRLMSLIGKRELMISAHKVRSNHWDFLYLIDLQKLSEATLLKEQIQQVYSMLDFKVTYRKYKEIDIIELTSKKTHEILYTAFIDNHYIASYSSQLIQVSIDERDNPVIGLDPNFIEVNKLIANKGIFRIYLQYAYLPGFLEMYMGKEEVFLPIIGQSIAYTGLKANVSNQKIELNGYTLFNESVDPYISALFHSGKKEMQAHKILSDRTAFYTNIGFDNPITFVKELEKGLSTNNPREYELYKSSYKKIESTLDISLTADFLSWMSGEFAFTESEPGLLGHDPEIILAIGAQDIHLAKEKMAFIEKKIKKRTPVSIKAVSYKEYPINYVELKGFFSLFFGKMFDKFEKPYYTYLGNYVVLSNKPASLLSFVEDYEQKRTLDKDKGFKHIISQVNKKSTYFVYTHTQKIFPLLQPVLNKKSWDDLNINKEIVYSFPHAGLQIANDKKQATMQVYMDFSLFEEEIIDEPVEPEDESDIILSEKEEIDELNRFYAEKFQGNIYREFYPEGSLKSECEIREGKRHGKYHEYYPNGVLKIRGKYSKEKPKGTWIYYAEDGKPERKVKT